jgi:hypothetical protein
MLGFLFDSPEKSNLPNDRGGTALALSFLHAVAAMPTEEAIEPLTSPNSDRNTSRTC